MGLQAILDTILAASDERVNEIELNSYRQANEILAVAGSKAHQIKEDICASTVAPAYRERARILHHARLEALRITGRIREALIDAALDQARGRFRTIRSDERYPAILARLAEEALAELAESLEETGTARLEADKRDRTILENILQSQGLNLQISYSLECWGGLIAKSEDQRIVVINTLEARIELATPYLRRYLAALFEDVQCMTMEMPAYAP